MLEALAQDKPTEEAFCGISWVRRDKNKCCDQFCLYGIIHSLVNSNDLNFNDVMCLVLHSKIKFFFFGGGGGKC